MDAKITKQRLSSMLSYDWVKIIGVIVAICIVWSLIFTMTATQITPTQKFYVYNYSGNRSFSATGSKFGELYNKAFREEFSYEILETGSEDLTTDINTILEARFAVGEGDLLFIANAKNPNDRYNAVDEEGNNIKDADGNDVYLYHNYTETFARGRFRYLYELEGTNNYFTQAEAYLGKYFFNDNGKADWENGKLDEVKAKADFRTRVKKDKRFKTEAQLLAGEAADIARLNSYRDALKEFYGYLDQELVKFETITLTLSETETKDYTCYLNLNPSTVQVDEATGKVVRDENDYPMYNETVPNLGLEQYLAYYEDVVNDAGETKRVQTSRNMCVGFLTMDVLEEKYRVEEGFQCESLLFVNLLIRSAHGLES